MESFMLIAEIFILALCLVVLAAACAFTRRAAQMLNRAPAADDTKPERPDEAEEMQRREQKRWDEGVANLLSYEAGAKCERELI